MAFRYWVGGTGNWSDSAHWSYVSGGAGGASLPASADSVVFDTNSHTTNYTVTVDVAAVCTTLAFTAPSSGNVTFAGSASLTMANSGTITLYAGLVFTFTGGVLGQNLTITSAGQTWTTAITLTNVLTLAAALNIGSNALTVGTGVTSANFALTCGALVSTRAVTFSLGSSTVACSSITTAAGSNCTLTLTTATVTCSGAVTLQGTTVTATLASGTLSCTTFSIAGSVATIIVNTASTISCTSFLLPTAANIAAAGAITGTFGTVNIAAAASFTINTYFACMAMSLTSTAAGVVVSLANDFRVNGALTISGLNAGSGRIVILSSVENTQRTITAASIGTLSNVDLLDTIGAGAATWTGTAIGNLGNCSGITFTGAVTRYWVGNSGNFGDTAHWSTSSGGASGASAPLPQDTAVFDASSFSLAGQTVTFNGAGVCALDFSAVTNNPILDTSVTPKVYIAGAMTLKAGMTWTNRSVSLVTTGSSNSWNCAGITVGASVIVSKTLGQTLTLTGNLVLASGQGFTVADGGFAGGTANVTATTFVSNSGRTRVVSLGSGVWTFSGSTTPWTVTSTGQTWDAGTSRLVFDVASGTATIATGALVYYDVTVQGVGTSAITFTGASSFHDIAHTYAGPTTVLATSANDVTQTGTGAFTVTMSGAGTLHNITTSGVNVGATTFNNVVSTNDLNIGGTLNGSFDLGTQNFHLICNDITITASISLTANDFYFVSFRAAQVRDLVHTGSAPCFFLGTSYIEGTPVTFRDITAAGGQLRVRFGTCRNITYSGVGSGPVNLQGGGGTANEATVTGAFVITDFPKSLSISARRLVFTTTPAWALGGGVGGLGGGTGPDEMLYLGAGAVSSTIESPSIMVWPDVPAHLDYVSVSAVTVQGPSGPLTDLTWGKHSRVSGGELMPWPHN